MRICVRSLMPITWPSTVTRSPARSLRIASSVVGKVMRCSATTARLYGVRPRTKCVTKVCQESGFPVVVHRAVRGDVRGRTARSPALVVDGDGIERHVRVGVLDVRVQNGNVAAESHRADAGLVQELRQLLLELRDFG